MDGLERMERALKAASDAGDVQAAGAIAAEMRRMLKEVNPNVDAPMDMAAEGARMAAKGTGAAEAALIGAGRTADKVVAGVKQAYLALPTYPLLEHENRAQKEKLAAEQAERDRVFAALRKERPITATAGEAAPYVAVPASSGVLPAAATVGAIEASQYGTPGERVARGVAGAGSTLVGGVVGKGAASFIAPVRRPAASRAAQGALESAERIGMQPTLGEATGSSFLRRLEDAAARSPGGGGVMADHFARNQTAVNRAAARSVGEVADEMSPEVFAAAHERLGKVFEAIKALPGRQIQLGPDVAAAADKVLRTQAKMLPHQKDANLIKIAQDAKALALNKGRIDGETYQLQRSGLSDAAFDATVGTNKNLYGRLLKAIDDSADASLRSAGNTALADALRTARPQYANLKTLEKGATAEAWNVSPARVASTMRTNNPGAFRRGDFMGSDIGDIARVGEGLKPLRPGSPTFERDASTSLLHALWSYPFAKVATSPAATFYPRTIGNTAAARTVAQIADPSTRAAVAAALLQSGALPLSPVVTE